MDKSGMESDHYFAEMLGMMREQGAKDNPVTLQLGIMQSANSVKVDDLVLNAEDLYIADYLLSGHTREIKIPYVSNEEVEITTGEYDVKDVKLKQTKQAKLTYIDGFKKGDLVAVQKLENTNKYVILARVVEV